MKIYDYTRTSGDYELGNKEIKICFDSINVDLEHYHAELIYEGLVIATVDYEKLLEFCKLSKIDVMNIRRYSTSNNL